MEIEDIVRSLAAIQSRLHVRGAHSQQEQAERARYLRLLEDKSLEVSVVVERWIEAGRDAVLYVHDSGDVILWHDSESAENDDGRDAVDRWQVGPETVEALAPIAEG